MKKVCNYIGLLALMCFSFYYADKVAKFMNNEDEIMKNIKEYAKKYNTECTEGYITEEGVVLGVNGLTVDTESSYYEMKGIGFDASLLSFKENPCIVSKLNNKDDFIIRGNEIKNALSLIINITNGKSISNVLQISKTKNVKLSLMMDDVYLSKNKNTIMTYLNDGNDILYKGKKEEDLKVFLNELKSIDKEAETYCVYENNNTIIDYCFKNNINTIKTEKKYNSSYLSKIKNNIQKGDFIILDESTILKDEIGVIINYIRSRGIKISTISKHLSN